MAAWVESVGATDYGIFGGQTKKNEGRNPACEEDLLQIALLNRDFGIKYIRMFFSARGTLLKVNTNGNGWIKLSFEGCLVFFLLDKALLNFRLFVIKQIMIDPTSVNSFSPGSLTYCLIAFT